MDQYEPNPVAEYLRRIAPSRSHEDRRAFLKAARVLDGARLKDDANYIYMLDIPVGMNCVWIGFVELTIELIDGQPAAHAVYKPKVDKDSVGAAAGR